MSRNYIVLKKIADSHTCDGLETSNYQIIKISSGRDGCARERVVVSDNRRWLTYDC